MPDPIRHIPMAPPSYFGRLCLSSVALFWALVLPGAAQEVSFRAILSRLAPKDPQQSLACLQVRSGFRVELVCSEPLVSDPIAIDWGPDGRLWVVEMGDYPQGQDDAEMARGRIRFLEDTDHDGRYDRSTVFLDGLSFPTGVMCWENGVLITCAPDLLYAEDVDGDGKADRREVLFRGFVEGNPQHRVNCLRWGLDNWVYGANGDSGGIILSLKTGRQVDIHARDFRLRPDTGVLETQTGMSQYGRCRDDWGNWFGGRNLQPSWHCALDDQYLRRNPYLVPPDPCVDLMDPPTCARVYPISTPLPRFNEFWTLNRFTAACGIAVYRDDLFGPSFSSSYFVCEPTYNLVHRSVLCPQGTTYSSRRASDEQQSEFLASTDHWFRPVQVRTGPDGALWVVDMYRLVIEHPDYIPAKWHAELDFFAGCGQGRIYRVLPCQVEARPVVRLVDLLTAQLVQALDHPNGSQRDTVQRLLVSRRDRSAAEALRAMAGSSPRAKTRLSALCTLDGLGALDATTLLPAVDDSHAAVRRHAIRLSEKWLGDSSELSAALLQRLQDPDPQVRMQLAYTLGAWDDRRAGDALARIALRDPNDPLLIAAVMSSATQYPEEMLQRLLSHRAQSDAQVALIANLLRLVLESEQTDALVLGLRRIAAPLGACYEPWQYTLLASLIDAIEYRGQTLQQWHEEASGELRQAIEATSGLFEQAEVDAVDASLADSRRVEAMRLMGRALKSQEDDALRLSRLLVPQTPVVVQSSVVDAMARLAPEDLPDILLPDWARHGPDVRPKIVAILVGREKWALRLLDYVAAGDVLANELGVANRGQLILHSSAQVRSRASQLFRPSTASERLSAIDRYRQGLQAPANVIHGRELFRKHCTTCHRLENEGTDIGPDLLALTDRSPEALLVAILDPDRAVEPRYVEYSAETLRGHVFSGIVTGESGNSVTLIDAQGIKHTLVRSEVVDLVSTGKSLMPVGVEELLTSPNDLTDLIAYVRSVEADPATKRPVTEHATLEYSTLEEGGAAVPRVNSTRNANAGEHPTSSGERTGHEQ